MNGKRINRLGIMMLFFGFTVMVMGSVYAGEKEMKISGTVIESAEKSSKLAPIAIKTDTEIYGVQNNAVAKKMKKVIGKKVEVTGTVEEIEGKNVIKVWNYYRLEGKKRVQPTG